jgi:F0F1-type ATP synthase epsilon subunit
MSLLNVRVLTPKKIIFKAEATSVSSTNSAGKFDILPEHANFITIIEDQDLIIKALNKFKKFHFPLAIIYTKNNTVNIYTDISTQS